jgi:hypothetical protein
MIKQPENEMVLIFLIFQPSVQRSVDRVGKPKGQATLSMFNF